ncbi:MAG: hypothetical protein GY679_05295 [Mycoplasma sp.]|nr:hypothetical protein [Mycoplasma sp.]
MKIKIIISWIAATLITISGFLIIKSNYISSSEIIKKIIYIKAIGAVENGRTITLEQNATMKELLSKINLLPNADRQKIDMNQIFLNDQTIIFPFKNKDEKIKINNKIKYRELEQLGVTKKVKKELFDYFKHNKRWSWEDIDSLPGVGIATLKVLKEQLDISYGI